MKNNNKKYKKKKNEMKKNYLKYLQSVKISKRGYIKLKISNCWIKYK